MVPPRPVSGGRGGARGRGRCGPAAVEAVARSEQRRAVGAVVEHGGPVVAGARGPPRRAGGPTAGSSGSSGRGSPLGDPRAGQREVALRRRGRRSSRSWPHASSASGSTQSAWRAARSAAGVLARRRAAGGPRRRRPRRSRRGPRRRCAAQRQRPRRAADERPGRQPPAGGHRGLEEVVAAGDLEHERGHERQQRRDAGTRRRRRRWRRRARRRAAAGRGARGARASRRRSRARCGCGRRRGTASRVAPRPGAGRGRRRCRPGPRRTARRPARRRCSVDEREQVAAHAAQVRRGDGQDRAGGDRRVGRVRPRRREHRDAGGRRQVVDRAHHPVGACAVAVPTPPIAIGRRLTGTPTWQPAGHGTRRRRARCVSAVGEAPPRRPGRPRRGRGGRWRERRRRAATPVTSALARASVPTWLSKGPAPSARDHEGDRRAGSASGDSGAVGDGDDDAAGRRRSRRRRRAPSARSGAGRSATSTSPGSRVRERAGDRDAVSRSTRSTPGAQQVEVRRRAARRCRPAALAGQDPHAPACGRPAGDGRGRTASRSTASSVRWTLSASRAQRSPRARRRRRARRMRSAAGRSCWSSSAADRGLEPDPAVVAEAVGQADDGGAAGARPAAQLGDGAEGGHATGRPARPRPPGARPGGARRRCASMRAPGRACNGWYARRAQRTSAYSTARRRPR